MKIRFKSPQLGELFRRSDLAFQHFGRSVGCAFIFAVNMILSVPHRQVLNQFQHIGYKPTDKGYFSIELGENHRLVCVEKDDLIIVLRVEEERDAK